MVLEQAAMVINLAKEKGVKELRVGKIEVVLFSDDDTDDPIGFEVPMAPESPDGWEDEPDET